MNRPVVVVGAARSGTTLIRRALRRHPRVRAFDYERNYMWRYGNAGLEHDRLSPEEHLLPGIREYIRSKFAGLVSGSERRPLDKTVANVLRLGYVHAVLPEAQIVHVIRDGRAAAASARDRWRASAPPVYYLRKAATVPLRDLPVYVGRRAMGRLQALAGRDREPSTWGPRYPGIDADVREGRLIQVCARQWARCVEHGRDDADRLSDDRYVEIRYEAVVERPRESAGEILRFLGLAPTGEVEQWLEATADPSRRDRWRGRLSREERRLLEEEAGDVLERLGYR